jgi:hypothetical protein
LNFSATAGTELSPSFSLSFFAPVSGLANSTKKMPKKPKSQSQNQKLL